jgi:hypothetical protein
MEQTICEAKWSVIQASFERQHNSFLGRYPEAADEMALIRKALAEKAAGKILAEM